MSIDLDLARAFMTAHARVLDRRRFDVIVKADDASRAAIIAALGAYRNPDGGVGWGLEPDLRAGESQPAAAQHAFEALATAGPEVWPHTPELLHWLDRATLDDGGLPFALPIAESTGCAPFWGAADPTESSLQITAAVAAQAHKAARYDTRIAAHPWLARATDYCMEQIRRIDEAPFAYVLSFALQLLDVIADEHVEARASLDRLLRFVPADGALAVEGGAEGETIRVWSEPGRPLHELMDARSIDAELDRLEQSQLDDGGWPVDFTSYSDAATLEWRGHTTVNVLALLSAHGRLP